MKAAHGIKGNHEVDRMDKRIRFLAFVLGALLSTAVVHADMVIPPYNTPTEVATYGVFTYILLLVGVAFDVCLIGVIAWLIIRKIKKKNASK